MRMFVSAMSILGIILAGSILYSVCLFHSVDDLSQHVEAVQACVQQEAWEDCDAAYAQFLANWDRRSKWLTLFLQHSDMDLIEDNIYQLGEYIRAQDKEQAGAYAAVIHRQLSRMANNERFTLQNLL